jgi:hypothetical protein
VEGDRFIVAAGATGAWSGWDDDIALFGDGIWFRLPKQVGWRAWVEDEGTLVVWDGAQWFDLSGVVGSDGASAYEVWIAEGNAGSEAEFLASLVGADGAPGPEGPQGPSGANGIAGPQGPTGEDGADGADGTSVTMLGVLASTSDLPGSGNTHGDGYIISGDLHVWDGMQWNNVGPIQGPQGDPGAEGSPGANGIDGASAFQIWLDAGNSGTETDYLATLVGAEGPPGPVGPEGPQGPAGVDGADGINGADGSDGADGLSFVWQGPWVTATGYALNDVVENDGSVFICITAHTSAASDQPGWGATWETQWDLFASGADLSAQGTLGAGPVVLAWRTVNAQAGSYTLALADEGAAIHMTSASAVTLTVPANSAVAFPTGAEIEVVALGAGVVSITADTGVSINGVSAGSVDIAAQWQGAVLRKYDTDAWLLIGAVGDVT